MEVENLIKVKTRPELRKWLEEYSTKETCCWIIVSRSKKATPFCTWMPSRKPCVLAG